MPRTTSNFVTASASYVAHAVKRANADGNAFLTKAESEKLPKDLQDNVANFRARGSGNGVVGAKTFVKAYEGYVVATSLKADANENGLLSRAEARALPKDLRDNYAHFAATQGGVISIGRAEASLSPAQLKKAAEDFIVKNSGGGFWDDTRTKLYPDPDGGNMGVFAYSVSGDVASRVAQLAEGCATNRGPLSVDPATENLLVVRTTDDEEHYYFAVQNKATGKVTPWGTPENGDINSVDIEYFVGIDLVQKLFPQTAGSDYTDPYEYLVTDTFEKLGTELSIGRDPNA